MENREEQDYYDNYPLPGIQNQYSNEELKNIISQINPRTIVMELDHSLKGQYYNERSKRWEDNLHGIELVNDHCRIAIRSFLNGVLQNSTTLGNLNEKTLTNLMLSTINSVKREFIGNLEMFGFVPKAQKKEIVLRENQLFLLYTEQMEETDQLINVSFLQYKGNPYENKGVPNTATMTLVADMIYKACFIVFTRALNGQESRRIFKSLSMHDSMMPQQQNKSWIKKIFGE